MYLPSNVGFRQARASQAVREQAAKLVEQAQSSSSTELPKVAWSVCSLPGDPPDVREAWDHLISRARIDTDLDPNGWGKLLAAFHQAKIVDLEVLNQCRRRLASGVEELDVRAVTALATAFSGPQVNRRDEVLLLLCRYLNSRPPHDALSPFAISALCKAYAHGNIDLPHDLPPLLHRTIPALAENMNAQDLHNLCLFATHHRCRTTKEAVRPFVERLLDTMPHEFLGSIALCYAKEPLAQRCVELTKKPASASIAVKLMEAMDVHAHSFDIWRKLALGLEGATRQQAVRALKCCAKGRFRAETIVVKMIDDILDSKEAVKPWSVYEVCAVADAMTFLEIPHQCLMETFIHTLKDPQWAGEKRPYAEAAIDNFAKLNFPTYI